MALASAKVESSAFKIVIALQIGEKMEIPVKSLLATGLLGVVFLFQLRRLKPAPHEAKCVSLVLMVILILLMLSIFITFLYPQTVSKTALWLLFLEEGMHRWAWVFAFLTVSLSYTAGNGEWQIHRVAGCLLIGLTLCCTLFHAAGTELTQSQIYSFQGYHRPHGVLLSPLEAGLVALIAWALSLVLSTHSGWRKLIGLVLTGLSTVTVYLTFSRSAWLGLCIAFLIGLIRYPRLLWAPLTVTLGMFVLCSIEMPLGWSRVAYVVQSDPSVQSRIERWIMVPSILLHCPFGIAGKKLFHGSEEPPMVVSFTSNFYFDTGVHYGVIPLILLIGVTTSLLYHVSRWIKQGTPKGILGLGVVATVLCLIFMNPTEDVIASTLLGGFWGMVSAMEVTPDEPPRLHPD